MHGVLKWPFYLFLTGVVLPVSCAADRARPTSAPPTKAPNSSDDEPCDLTTCLGLADFYVKPVVPMKEAASGFIVGGKNSSALIRSLTEINGKTIADLERDMRPGAPVEVGSDKGFLGPEEKLLDVLFHDNQLVVDELALTHQEIAKHLHAMGAIATWQQARGKAAQVFLYQGRRYRVRLMVTRGFQMSPFEDGTKSGSNVAVENLDTGKKLEYALLVPYMIERYGFYEGRGTPYRVEPRRIVEVFDFLQSKPSRIESTSHRSGR